MGRITVELLRKRAEHNEGEIQSLEELSLHQEKLEKIELIDRVCRKLRILLLQNNAIGRIENLNRLKNLEYLNMALNMVERIENLEGCESLKKLDLTLNFIGEISSIKSLRSNYYLEQLYMVGNPCHDFPGYRDYIIAVLPQVKQLDGVEVTKSERIQARQNFDEIEARILLFEEACLKDREKSKSRCMKAGGDDCSDIQLASLDKDTLPKDIDEDDDDEEFWSKVTGNTPEARLEMCRQLEKLDAKKNERTPSALSKPKIVRKLETTEGRPLNMNEPKLSFTLHDEMERNQIVLDLAVPKFLCTTLIDADVQPTYVRVKVKGKCFQLVLPEEVKPDSSYAHRSQTTGHLVVTMPKVHENSSLVWRGSEGGQLVDLTKDHAPKEPKKYDNANKDKNKIPLHSAKESEGPVGRLSSPATVISSTTSAQKLKKKPSILKTTSTEGSTTTVPGISMPMTPSPSGQRLRSRRVGSKSTISDGSKLSVRWSSEIPPLI